MDAFVQYALEYLKAQGLLGIIVVVLIYIAWNLNKSRDAERLVFSKEKDDLQEKRLAEAKENILALHANTTALNALTMAISRTKEQ